MAPIPCSVPDCETTFQDTLPEQVLLAMIQMHAVTVHQATAVTNNQQPTVKPETYRRPTVTSSGTDEEFTYFLQRWNQYKQATRLQAADTIFQLLECCTEDLRKDLARTYGDLTGKDEDTVKGYIKSLAVRPENHLVARVQLQQLRQDREEPVRSFCARLRGQAGVCRFIKQCSCNPPTAVDYSEDMIRDCLIRNIDDEDIRLDVLGQADQDMSLTDVLQLIEAKESGKRSASRLVDGASVTPASTPVNSAAMTSNYRRQNNQFQRQNQPQRQNSQFQRQNQPPRQNNQFQYQNNQSKPRFNKQYQRSCTHCGQTDHIGSLPERMKKCPAYNKQCSKCGIHHHLPSMCHSQRSPQSSQNFTSHNDSLHQNEQVHVYNSLCDSISFQTDSCSAIKLDHHVYDNLNKTWTKRHSDPQPNINVSVSFHPSDAPDLNLPAQANKSSPVTYPAMPDTGCQSCLSGPTLLRKLNLSKSDLYPVSMSMTAANNRSINIIGAMPLRITGESPAGSKLTTRQIIYFTDNTDKLFLSKESCKALGIIS